MTDVLVSTKQAVVDHLDGLHHAVTLGLLVNALPEHSVDDIKAATRELYDERAINRVSVKAPKGGFFYVFYSLYVRTVNVYRDEPEAPPAPAPEPEPTAEPALALDAPLTPDEAVDVLTRGGWVPEPEVVTVERRVADRRASRIGVMDVIDRWKLGYRLSRIIEIVGGARRRPLTEDDAELVVRLIREHVTPPTE